MGKGVSRVFRGQVRRIAGYYGRLIACGFAMGSADIVPGVSGGTMAFILGIYEELIFSIRAIARPAFWQALRRGQVVEALQIIRFPFLAAVGTGILLAIFTLARALSWLLANYPTLVWSFFFGLVLASVWMVGKRVQEWKRWFIIPLAVSSLFAFWLVGSLPAQTPKSLPWFFLSGMLASVAMILPGISGAFILVLLGKYQDVLHAVGALDVITLGTVATGAMIGLVTVAQVLGWLFRRYHDFTVVLLTGFMLGSLRKLWPWKETSLVAEVEGEIVPIVEQLTWPALHIDGQWNLEVWLAFSIMMVGMLVVRWIDRLAQT